MFFFLCTFLYIVTIYINPSICVLYVTSVDFNIITSHSYCIVPYKMYTRDRPLHSHRFVLLQYFLTTYIQRKIDWLLLLHSSIPNIYKEVVSSTLSWITLTPIVPYNIYTKKDWFLHGYRLFLLHRSLQNIYKEILTFT